MRLKRHGSGSYDLASPYRRLLYTSDVCCKSRSAILQAVIVNAVRWGEQARNGQCRAMARARSERSGRKICSPLSDRVDATGHATLDCDRDMQEEVANVARAVAACIVQGGLNDSHGHITAVAARAVIDIDCNDRPLARSRFNSSAWRMSRRARLTPFRVGASGRAMNGVISSMPARHTGR